MTHRIVLENLRHKPLRTALSVFLVGVPVTLILTLVGLSQGMIEDSQRRSRGVGADIMVRPKSSSALSLSGAPLPEGIVKRLAQEAHVKIASGVVVYVIPPFTSINGIHWDEINAMSGGFKFLEGGPFRNPDDIIIDSYYASQNNVHAGGTVRVLNRDWRVAGIVEPGILARILLPIRIMQDLTAASGRVSQVYLKVDDPRNAKTVIDRLKAQEAFADYPIYSMEEFTSLVSVSSIPELSKFIDVTVGISIVIGFAVVFLSMYTAVLQRTREIGILKSLGASRWYVLRLILVEALMLGLAGTVLGILLTYAAKWMILTLVPSSLRQAIVPFWWPRAGLIALFAALGGALYPGMRAARQDPIEALAYE